VILVTGATGFIGPKVVHALRARDLPVRCLVRQRGRGSSLEAWGCELAEGNMTDPTGLRRAVTGCEVVVHLVAIISGRPDDFERVMSQGTRDLVAAAREADVKRFVLMSALGLDEETKDLVPYYRAKWAMEQAVKSSGLEHTIFRPSFVFGRDGGVLPTFVRLARYAPVTPIIGPGTQRIQPIWVDDVAAYYAKAVDLPAAANRTFELGGPDAVTWNEFWSRLKRALGKRRPSVHLPFGLMQAQAVVLERLPGAPITRDQLKMLGAGDNTCDMGPALEAFELPVLPLEEQLRRAA
jgi:NADH dehydrogenase